MGGFGSFGLRAVLAVTMVVVDRAIHVEQALGLGLTKRFLG